MKRKTDLTAAAYVFHEDKLLLILHSKLNLWLPPGGHIEPNETPDEAALRETREETGINASLLNILPLEMPSITGNRDTPVPFFTNVHSVGDHDHWGACYLCTTDTPDVRMTSEIKQSKWFSQGEIESDPRIRADIRAIALAAFDHYKKLRIFK